MKVRVVFASSALLLTAGCPESPPPDPCADVLCAAGTMCEMGECVAAPVCNPAQPRWTPGTLAFTEETSS